ncbi:lauroyl acyltransferase [Roseomonas sp. GC11]|uniref:LpxL/LpxP family acyltransferase n=1 Tax=Roseomonas sp. GC11 TaxID=2950546 RepID=UPI00210ED3C6|nr:lauroyl acyltransferase [Roseomonas sp. GC11]MCQ4161112.1 lauroyl acyltransferase [Roseomonas sp. GC11]
MRGRWTSRLRRVRWRIEAALARVALALARALGPVGASGLGGAVLRGVGPWLPVSHVGRRNLALAFPERDAAWRESVLRDAWENLGRTVMELPHLTRLRRLAPGEPGPGWELAGEENLPPGPARLIFVSAHLANWETLPLAAHAVGLNMASLYRAPDNPLVDDVLHEMRRGGVALQLFPKGSRGARQVLRHLSDGHALGLLVDQKLNEGAELTLLGQPAMTATGAADLALRFACPLVPARVQRLGPCHFRVALEPPLVPPESGDRIADGRELSQQINDRMTAWIRERPGEWLWLHRRFPRSVYQQ